MKNLEKSIYENYYFSIIEKCKSNDLSLDLACIKLDATGISFKVTNKEPNKIYYWFNDIEGFIIK